MNNNSNKKSIQDNIRSAIENGSIKMRPRWHFILRTALLATGMVLVACTLIYIASFIIFVVHQTGVWFVPSFGLRGVEAFLTSLPWILIFIAILFIIILENLVRKYSFAYRRPLLYSAFGVIGLVTAGALIISATPLHSFFLRNAREGHLPIAGGLYRDFGMRRFHDIHPCTIIEITPNGFKALYSDNEEVNVIINAQTRLPQGEMLQVHDTVLVFGEGSTTIYALGVRKIDALEENHK
jgi:vacuolar-type H+-ATPase subunit I/STV1